VLSVLGFQEALKAKQALAQMTVGLEVLVVQRA
jgi:hypothetical protein